MRAATYSVREFVVEFPDDGGESLGAIMEIIQGGGMSIPLGGWLLHFTNETTAVHARMAFDHLTLTADRRFIVPDSDRQSLESWIDHNPTRGRVVWSHLEAVTPWTVDACRRWASAYRQVLGWRPRLRSLKHWPQLFEARR